MMAVSATQFTLLCVIGIIFLAQPAHAFGAGNIGSTSKIEGENWRHGDLEDVLLTLVASKAMGGKKFSKLDVKRIYFGNWLRDYSQAVDVGTVKNVSAEAIRVVLWILGFMSFGYGTKEFEVTTARLGCYRPEEHIDNPKDYAENEDARNYDRRLRGPVDERRELAIDPVTGLKAYIASENLGIDTSAALVRKLYSESIELGRRYARNKNKADLHEALRLLGTANHCLEDFSAHSNYTELALIEMGERDVFPHVGRNCQVHIRGARSQVYPLVTGTFGGVDFLHSVTGEFDDKVTQSEIQELEGTLSNAQQQGADQSMLQDLLHKLPDGIFGGKDEAGKADELQQNSAQHQMANTRISPREPEEWLQYINDAQRQIYPILEWHDEVMQSITEFMEKVPILPDLLENVSEQVNVFVFSLIAPFMLPIITQIKSELNTGSNTIIQSSVDAQHIVFRDDNCSDPTHSMLSKDHFSNILNEPAGKIAGSVLRWVIPQIINAWDDERVDVDRTINRIIQGVFHHPALRDAGDDGASDGRRAMFAVVEKWWNEKSEREKDGLRDQLSRDGVEQSRNHKPGVHDHGHGSAKKLGMPNMFTSAHPGAPGGLGNVPSSGFAGTPMGQQASQSINQFAGEAVGGGALGSIVGGIAGGLVGAVGTGVMNTFKENDDNQTESRTTYGNDGSRTQTTTQYGGRPGSGNYSQSQYSRTDDRSGGRTEQYSSHQQSSSGYGGGYSESSQQTSTYGSGGYSSESRRYESSTTTTSSYGRREEQNSSSGYGSSGFGGGHGNYGSGETTGGYGSQQSYGGETTGGYGSQQQSYSRGDDNERSYGQTQQSYGRRDNDDDDDSKPKYGRKKKDDDDDDDDKPKYGRRQKKESDDDDDDKPKYGRRKKQSDDEDDDDDKPKYGRRKKKDDDDSDDDKKKRYSSSRQEESRYGSNTGGYGGRQQEESYGSSGYGRSERNEYSGGQGGYGRQETSSYGGGNEYSSGGDRQEYSSGGGGGYGRSEGYGGSRRGGDEEPEMPGGFGEEDEGRRQGGYGRQNRGDEYSSGGGYGGGNRWN